MDYKYRNVLALAYVGDSVYEIYIRKHLFLKGIEKVNDLQKEATNYVSAKGQARYLREMINQHFLTEEELQLVTRTRNHKSHDRHKNTDVATYHDATGLEALIGYLFLSSNDKRVEEIMNFIIGG